MGIENRDYMSSEPSFRFGGVSSWSAVKTLVVINVIVFILQSLFMQQRLLESWLQLGLPQVLHGQIWRLTTYDFLHETGDAFPWHLLFNMWLLWIAGGRVENTLGKREFLAFYLLAGVVSGIVFLIWSAVTHSSVPVIGASGAAIAVMIVYAMHWPHDRWYIWGVLPIPVMVLALLAVAQDLLPMLSEISGRGSRDLVAHSAHIGGMLFGFLYVSLRWRITDWLPSGRPASRRSSRRARPFRNPLRRRPELTLHVEEPDEPTGVPPEVEVRLDSLLEKITRQGEASLTAEERHFLAEASRRYRNRQ
jgi:membrane associated rhomboid family serine protease